MQPTKKQAIELAPFLELKPPTPLSELDSYKTVFLAGSIDQGNAVDWQSSVSQILRSYSEETGARLAVLNPRREQWDASWVQSIDNPEFKEQVDWELDALQLADVILMHFSEKSAAPISLLELGLFADSGRMMVCCPPAFYRKGNVDIVCSRYAVPTFDSLEELMQKAKEKLASI